MCLYVHIYERDVMFYAYLLIYLFIDIIYLVTYS